MSGDSTRPLPEWWDAPKPPGAPGPSGPPGPPGPLPVIRRRRRRGPIIALITVVVILVILVVGDRVANAYTENQMASQFQSSVGLSSKPHVTIQGFPFLTQLIRRDFRTVDITATNETITATSLGSGALEIASLNATLHGMHIHGFNSATVDQFNATALVTFTALGNVGGIPSGITLAPDGPNQVKATVNVAGLFSDTATAQVTQSGPNQITVKVIDAGGIPADLLGNLADFTVSLPKLPAGVTIQSVSVTQQGLQVTITGQNTTLSQ
jgi:LmeA-like phospholipid-binding